MMLSERSQTQKPHNIIPLIRHSAKMKLYEWKHQWSTALGGEGKDRVQRNCTRNIGGNETAVYLDRSGDGYTILCLCQDSESCTQKSDSYCI